MINFKKGRNIGYYRQHVLQQSSNRGRFAVKKGRMMRTWHLWIRTLIIRWVCSYICIMISYTIHLVPHVHVSIWLKVQLCFKVQAHQSPTFGSSASQQCFFTLGTPAQVGACLKDVKNTLEMDQNILHLGHHLRRPVRGVQANWRPKIHQLQVCFGFQEQPTLKRTPRSHTESDLGELYMVGKIIPRCF